MRSASGFSFVFTNTISSLSGALANTRRADIQNLCHTCVWLPACEPLDCLTVSRAPNSEFSPLWGPGGMLSLGPILLQMYEANVYHFVSVSL